jgi:Na+-driven multidrug efflux pump
MENRVDEFIANPRRALFVLAAPVAIAMFVQTMYNIVDTAFVGRLGSASIAALTFAFPIFFILISLNSGLGVGINSIISRFLGAKNKEAAENAATHGIIMTAVFAIAVTLLVYLYFLRKRSYLRVRFRSFRFSFDLCREICRVGAPASLMMLTMSIYIMFLNRFMAHFGTDYVASFGLATRLESLVSLPIFALSISLLTLVGMFYGAKRYDLVKSISWYGTRIGVLAAGAVGVLFYAVPVVFLKIFTQERLILMIGAAYLRIDVLTFPTMAIAMILSRVLQGMGFGFPGFIINAIRIFLVAVPLAYIFVFVLGYGFLSIAWAMVAGGVTASLLAFWWMGLKFRNLPTAN